MPTEMTDPARSTAEAPASLPDLVLYRRDGCHLCDEARTALETVLDARRARRLPTPAVVERDIATDPDLERRFGATIPVVELAGERLELVTSAGRLGRLLARVLDDR